MIDEAQHLDFDVLEQIRLLTNLETDEKKLLQIILTGQPELESMLGRPELRQLNQRITARYQVDGAGCSRDAELCPSSTLDLWLNDWSFPLHCVSVETGV